MFEELYLGLIVLGIWKSIEIIFWLYSNFGVHTPIRGD